MKIEGTMTLNELKRRLHNITIWPSPDSTDSDIYSQLPDTKIFVSVSIDILTTSESEELL